MRKFELLFSPRSVAVVGATDDTSRPGNHAVRALKRHGYRGAIYPVNPKYREIESCRCYGSLAEINDAIDVAVIAIPAEGAAGIVKNCGELGIPYAIVLGGGFREAGLDGLRRQNELIANGRAYGVRIVGPNCLGIANIHERMFAAFGSLTRPPLLAPGPVSMVMQSGGFGNSLSMNCSNAGIGFRLLIASGNEADITAPELVDAMVDDPATEIILAYIEGVADGRALMAAGERALAAGKPVLIWKGGNTQQGARAAATHTANMTGSYGVWGAALRQCGIIEIRDMWQAVDYIKALRARRYPRGRNVAVLSGSGGSAVVLSDAIDECGLSLPKPTGHTAAVLNETLTYAASLNNPIDLGSGGISERNRPRTLKAVRALLDDAEMHQLCLMIPVLVGERAAAGAAVLAEATQHTDKPIMVFSMVKREDAPAAFALLDRAMIPVLRSPVRVARVARMLADYAELRNAHQARRQRSANAPSPIPSQFGERDTGSETSVLDEARSKYLVSTCGIPITRDAILAAGECHAADTVDLNFPVAVKVLSPDVAHKTDAGGVVLNVADCDALRAAALSVVANARHAHPSARIQGVLVSEMISDAVEVIAGVVNDPVFGPVVVLGMGGPYAEALRDVTYRVAPFDRAESMAMIGELRARRIFDGVRGRPPCDIDALAGSLVRLSELAWQQRDRILELDINPLLVRPRGQGVVAADALVVLR